VVGGERYQQDDTDDDDEKEPRHDADQLFGSPDEGLMFTVVCVAHDFLNRIKKPAASGAGPTFPLLQLREPNDYSLKARYGKRNLFMAVLLIHGRIG
jgi:hypothetical protein